MTTTTAATTPTLHQLVLGDLGSNFGKFEHLMTSTNRELPDAVFAAFAASASDRVRHDDVDTLRRNKRARLTLVTGLPARLFPRLLLLVLLRAGLVRRRRLRRVRRVAVEDPLGLGEASAEFRDRSLELIVLCQEFVDAHSRFRSQSTPFEIGHLIEGLNGYGSRCHGQMRVIACIEEPDVAKKILEHAQAAG